MMDGPAINRFARRQVWRFRGKGPNGRNLCHCGCGREVVPPRRTSFSDECVKAWHERNDPTTIRRVILERDRGICAHCGLDTESLRRECLPYGCPVEPPDAFQIADQMGYQHQYVDGPRNRHEIKTDVAAAHDAAYYLWVREIEAPWRAHQEQRRREVAGLGFTDPTRSWWEADHIVPVSEGGGGCGPEGYRTLCLPCHRRETAKLAARLAAKRRVARETNQAALTL